MAMSLKEVVVEHLVDRERVEAHKERMLAEHTPRYRPRSALVIAAGGRAVGVERHYQAGLPASGGRKRGFT